MISLSFIQDRLKTTDAVKIADRTGYSRSHVVNVLAGRRTNELILKEAHRATYRRKAIA